MNRWIARICCDLNHMAAIAPGIQFLMAERMRDEPRETRRGWFSSATVPTLGFQLPNCSVTALWNERDCACI